MHVWSNRRVLNLLLEKGRCAAPAATSTLSVRVEAKAEEGLFWDGEIRQTTNKHVERGKNGEDGNPVWRLSEIIGDVCLPSRSHFLSLSRLPDVSDPSPIRRDVHTIEI